MSKKVGDAVARRPRPSTPLPSSHSELIAERSTIKPVIYGVIRGGGLDGRAYLASAVARRRAMHYEYVTHGRRMS